MNKATLFAVIFCGFLMSSFHHPQGSSTMASSAPVATATVERSISSEKVEVKKSTTVEHAQSLNK